MNGFSLHLSLIVAWVLLTGDLSIANFVLAFVLGFGALVMGRRVLGCESYVRQMPGGFLVYLKQVPSGFLLLLRQLPLGLIFFLRLVWDLIVSSLVIMIDVWSPVQRFKPRILRVPIKSATDLEITTLANCITLTPGTTTLDVTPDRDALIIHAMYAEDADEVRKSVTDDLEPRLLKFMRVAGGGKGNA